MLRQNSQILNLCLNEVKGLFTTFQVKTEIHSDSGGLFYLLPDDKIGPANLLNHFEMALYICKIYPISQTYSEKLSCFSPAFH